MDQLEKQKLFATIRKWWTAEPNRSIDEMLELAFQAGVRSVSPQENPEPELIINDDPVDRIVVVSSGKTLGEQYFGVNS